MAFWPTAIGASALSIAGCRLAKRNLSRLSLAALVALSCFAAMPALLFAAYYLHVLDRSAWFYQFRSLSGSELTAAGIGLLGGVLVGLIRHSLYLKSRPIQGVLSAAVLVSLVLVLAAPYAKPLIVPLSTPLNGEWREGVCIQSSPSTCGPASVATLLRQLGQAATEEQLAREAFSCGSGTENWYLARTIRNRGLRATYVIGSPEPAELPYPSMAGSDLYTKGGSGHFITVLAREGDRYVIGDPLTGRKALTREEIRKRYYLTGFFLVVSDGG
jgi:hypothetical protein